MLKKIKTRLTPVLLAILLIACSDAPPETDVDKIALPDSGLVAVGDDFENKSGNWQFFHGFWEYRHIDSNDVLGQTAVNLGRRVFPLALWKAHRFVDVDASVRFKPISGDMDASGGIVIRARDGDNYYIARANSLEDNIRLYTFIDGKRSRIASATLEPPALGQWHTLRVVALGPRIQVYMNDTLYIDHQDETYTEGYVGLWTKADAVTDFDDLVVKGVAAAAQ